MENVLQTKYGGLNVFELVGKKFGSKVINRKTIKSKSPCT